MAASSARYRANPARRSHSIRYKPASNLYHAIRIASALGRPLNRLVTINLTMAGSTDEQAGGHFAQVRDRLFDKLRRPGRGSSYPSCQPLYVYVVEAAGGVTSAHLLIHIPPGRIQECDARLRAWVAQAVGNDDFPENTIQSKPAPTPKGLGAYLLKGTDPRFAALLGADPSDQGLVYGKRSGFSPALGPTTKQALREAGTYPRVRPWARSNAWRAQAASAGARA